MSMSGEQKNSQIREEKKEEQWVTIDTNDPNCVFKLLHIAAVMEAEDGKIQFKQTVSKNSEKTVLNARVGQGLATIEMVDKDLDADEWIKSTFITPAFNEGDDLPREDKLGILYGDAEYAFCKAKVGQSGSGTIHTAARNIALIQKKMLESGGREELLKMFSILDLINFFSVKHEIVGCIFAGSIVKGAESHQQMDYKLHVLKKNSAEDGAHIRETFLNKEGKKNMQLDRSLLKKYDLQSIHENHLFLIQNDEHKSYEVYYIQNQKFIRSATKAGLSEVPQHIIEPFIQDIDNAESRERIVKASLTALALDKPFTINNKSLSQNDGSIFYDPDFESFIMYLNYERYLLDDKKQLMPEGKEWGSFFDLHRSLPMVLCDSLREQLLETFKVSDKKTMDDVKKQQQSKCSSWDVDQYPYEEVIKGYLKATKEEKLQVYADNIHTLLRLYEKTLQMYLNDEPIWGVVWKKKQVNHYFNNLEERLIQLLISYLKLSKELDFNAEFKSSLFKGDKRSLSQILDSLKQSSEKLRKSEKKSNFSFNYLNHLCHCPLHELRALHRDEMKQDVKSLCLQLETEDLLRDFNGLLRKSCLVCSDEKERKELLQKMLTEINVNFISPLENVVRNKSYKTAVMILFYGGINAEILKRVTPILKDRIKEEALQSKDPIPKDKRPLILDDFLRSYIRQVYRHGFSLPADFLKLIEDNAALLPKAKHFIEKLSAPLESKKESQAEDAAQSPKSESSGIFKKFA